MTAAPTVLTSEMSLPTQRGLFYGGAWHQPLSNARMAVESPATGESLGEVARASSADVDAAVAAARKGARIWRDVDPAERAKILREMAARLRAHARELALLDAADGGSPVRMMLGDAQRGPEQLEFFAGLVTEMKGSSVPLGSKFLNFSVRQPLGVVARIIPFNHPYMFAIGKSAAPLAAGNAVIVKAPDQAPLSALRLAELVGDLLPAGVFNVLTGDAEAGAALVSHKGVAKIALIGSVPTGKAVMRAAADTLKPVLLELGGKNALIAYPDADLDKVSAAIVDGMNFTWCGQSCGSTSRAFVHADIYDAVLERVKQQTERYRPGLPTDPETKMGAIVSRTQYEKVKRYIASAHSEGARLLAGGKHPADPALANGFFIEPTVFADVTQDMTIAREEIFGPVLSILKWEDEGTMLEEVNSVDVGLTCSIWTRDLVTAHRTALEVEAGYVWINQVTRHFLGTAFGGWKQSGLGREENLEELLSYTQEKSVTVSLA